MKKVIALLLAALLIFFSGCTSDSGKADRVIIGLSADIESLNPLYAFVLDEGNITELMFLSLVKHNWDFKLGNIASSSMLAKDFEWAEDSLSILINLRENVKWSDGKSLTVADIIFSLDVYSDPIVQSRSLGFFENYNLDGNGKIDIEKTFEVINDYQLRIFFKDGTKPSLFDIDHPVIPKHVLDTLSRAEIQTCEFNFKPVTNGPYQLMKWERDQSIRLTANKQSFLYSKEMIEEIIFKVIPEYNNRLLQLIKGEIDLMEQVKNEDANKVKQENHLAVGLISGREYDYIGYSNIDNIEFNKNGNIKPHKLFGNSEVRKAITHAINRLDVLENYLLNYGDISSGPVSKIFVNGYNNNLTGYDYNPPKSKELLKKSGWTDSNNNGIVDKDGVEFNFTLSIPSGNPRRKYAATIFQNNLKAVGIDVNVEFVEMGFFIDALYGRMLDAWMVGWVTPIPLNLKIQWNSAFEEMPANFLAYQNSEVDSLLLLYDSQIDEQEKNEILKSIQSILHSDEPCTFLYWIDTIVGYNKRIKNIDINPLGSIHHCWNWRVN